MGFDRKRNDFVAVTATARRGMVGPKILSVVKLVGGGSCSPLWANSYQALVDHKNRFKQKNNFLGSFKKNKQFPIFYLYEKQKEDEQKYVDVLLDLQKTVKTEWRSSDFDKTISMLNYFGEIETQKWIEYFIQEDYKNSATILHHAVQTQTSYNPFVYQYDLGSKIKHPEILLYLLKAFVKPQKDNSNVNEEYKTHF